MSMIVIYPTTTFGTYTVLHIAQFDPLHAFSYFSMPKDLLHRKGYVSVLNKDLKCLFWSILAHRHPAQDV